MTVRQLVTKQSFAAPTQETLAVIGDEARVSALRQAWFAYEARCRDLQSKFDAVISVLRGKYLEEVDAINSGDVGAA
jgi:hypothetical protein